MIRQVIEESEGGIFVRPGDDQAFADAVLYLEQNREQAKAMGKTARIYVETYFDRAIQAEEFSILLSTLCK